MDDISAVPKTVDELVIDFRCGVQISQWNLSCYNKHLLGLFLAKLIWLYTNQTTQTIWNGKTSETFWNK